MGSMAEQGMIEALDAGLGDLRSAVSWQVLGNHYPPPPAYMVDVAMEAVQSDDLYAEIALPVGVLFRGYRRVLVHEMLDAFHLWGFRDTPDED